MASVQTSSYSGRYLKLTVVEASTSISNNTSTVRWTLESIGGSATYYTIYNCKVVINGTTVYNPGTVRYETHNFPAAKGSKSGTVTITHRSDGTASDVSFALHGKVYNSGDENKTGSLSLSNIPRAPKYNSVSASSITETSVKLTASINTNGLSTNSGGWDLSTDGGSTWTYYSGGITNKTITGLNPNTKYWYRGYCVTDGGSTNSSWYTFTTYNYPYCTDSPNFNIGDNLTLKFYNPLGRTFNVKIVGNDGSVHGDNDFNSTTVTGWSNENWTNYFYQSIPNSNSGSYQVKVTYGNSVKTKTGGKYYTKTSECLPIFNNFTVQDGNTDTVRVTDDDQIFIKGYSRLWVTIPEADKMSTKKYANPNYYNINCDTHNNNISYNYRDGDIIFNVGTLNNSGTLRVNVRAYDTRNNSVSVYKDINVLNYNKPTINISAKRLNSFENETIVKISGTYTPLTIDNIDKNTIDTLKYRYREREGDWGNWIDLTPTISNGNFVCSDFILLLDNTKAFELEVKAEDYIDITTINTFVGVGKPIFFISSNKKNCYKNGVMMPNIDEIYPVGSIYLTVNSNLDPEELFGGTWELISQGKTLVGVDENDNDFNTARKTGGYKSVTLNTNQIPAHTHGSKTLTGGADFRRYSDGSTDIWGGYSASLSGIVSKTSPTWSGSHSTLNCNGLSKNNNLVDRLNINATHEHSSVGGGQAHTNLQPYFTCFIWCRTA